MKAKFLIIFLALTISLFFFQRESPYFFTTGESNGSFLGERIYISKTIIGEISVGDFIVVDRWDGYVVHPVVKVIKEDGEIVAFRTKGVENDFYDPIVFPENIVGKAHRILEDGSIEEVTRIVE